MVSPGIGSTYDKHIFYISNARANSDSTNLCMQVSTDGGSTWKAGATDYEYASHGYDSGGTNRTKTSTGDTKIFLSDLAKMGTRIAQTVRNKIKKTTMPRPKVSINILISVMPIMLSL